MDKNIWVVEKLRTYWFTIFCFALGIAMGYELVGGQYPKINELWLGPGAGTKIVELVNKVLEKGTWDSMAWLLTAVVIPFAPEFSYLVVALQLVVCLSLLIGIFVRPVLVAGLPMFIAMNVVVQTLRTPHWFITGSLVVIISIHGMYFGVDRYLLNRLQGNNKRWAHLIRFMITLNLEELMNRRVRLMLIGLLGSLTMFSLLHMAFLQSHVLRLTMLEAVVYLGFITVGLCIYEKANVSHIDLAIALMRIKLGIAILWPAIANPSVKITGLPGFADPQATTDLLINMVGQSHWSPMLNSLSMQLDFCKSVSVLRSYWVSKSAKQVGQLCSSSFSCASLDTQEQPN
ncbi:hypothetical protein KFU94_01050 [Chloroflexi bacterium TSY]|nr:hypothetical protein [Chloroflexi bacterium TSY]